MGASLVWRQPPPNLENRRYGSIVGFGRGRSAGRAYMAASSRVGPGVLVLADPSDDDASVRAFADLLNEGGFTALAPEATDSDSYERDVLEAAASFLTDNWHPMLGVLALGSAVAKGLALADRANAAAFVAYAESIPPAVPTRLPAMFHIWGTGNDEPPLGDELEIYLYETESDGGDSQLALDRTLDFLQYHLS